MLKGQRNLWKEENLVSFILLVEVKLKLDLPNCWPLYKLLKYIYIFNFLTTFGPSLFHRKLWFLPKQLHSTTQSRKTWIYIWVLQDLLTESVIPLGGSKTVFTWLWFVQEQYTDRGTWILKQLDSDINKYLYLGRGELIYSNTEWKTGGQQYLRHNTS